jgi:hypothetical protein
VSRCLRTRRYPHAPKIGNAHASGAGVASVREPTLSEQWLGRLAGPVSVDVGAETLSSSVGGSADSGEIGGAVGSRGWDAKRGEAESAAPALCGATSLSIRRDGSLGSTRLAVHGATQSR